MTTTETVKLTAALVLNQKLHLVTFTEGRAVTANACAGRRYGKPILQASVNVDLPGLGFERFVARQAATTEAIAALAAQITDATQADLCQKCAAHL